MSAFNMQKCAQQAGSAQHIENSETVDWATIRNQIAYQYLRAGNAVQADTLYAGASAPYVRYHACYETWNPSDPSWSVTCSGTKNGTMLVHAMFVGQHDYCLCKWLAYRPVDRGDTNNLASAESGGSAASGHAMLLRHIML
jgi:hypothetical protein